jgi:uncharacterized membrane-anchored protein YjiN (DUF445 family)
MNFQEILANAQKDISLQNTLNIDEIIEQDQNHIVLNLSQTKITEDIIHSLKSINLTQEQIENYCVRLIDYQYMDEIHELVLGKYIRWIRRADKTHKMSIGGIITDIMIEDSGVYLKIKIINLLYSCKLKYDEFLIYQKLSNDDKLRLTITPNLTS